MKNIQKIKIWKHVIQMTENSRLQFWKNSMKQKKAKVGSLMNSEIWTLSGKSPVIINITRMVCTTYRTLMQPWLDSSTGWSIIPYTKGLQGLGVWSPVRAHTKGTGSIPSQGGYRRQPINASLSYQCFSFSLLKKNKHVFEWLRILKNFNAAKSWFLEDK